MTTVWTVVKRGIGVVTTGLLCAALAACGGGSTGAAACSSDNSSGTTSNNAAVQAQVAPPDPDVRLNPGTMGLSPDGGRIAVPCIGEICIWDTSDGSITDRIPGGTIVAWSPDSSVIATNDGDANVVLMDADSGKQLSKMRCHRLLEGEDGDSGVDHLAFSPDGSMLASSASDGTVRLWSVPDGKQQDVFSSTVDGIDSPADLEFSSDGSQLAVANVDVVGQDDIVQIWDVASGKRVQKVSGSAPAGTHIAFGPKGQWFAGASTEHGETVSLADAENLDEHKTFEGDVSVQDLVFNPDGSMLAFTDREDEKIVLWPTGNGTERALSGGHKDQPDAVRFSPDGRYLYSASGKDGVVKWRADDGKQVDQFELPERPPSASE